MFASAASPRELLGSATYRSADLETLVDGTSEAIRELDVEAYVQASLDEARFLHRSEAAAGAVPTPPISSVLTTVVLLHAIGRPPTSQNVMMFLHHLWDDECAATMHLTS